MLWKYIWITQTLLAKYTEVVYVILKYFQNPVTYFENVDSIIQDNKL